MLHVETSFGTIQTSRSVEVFEGQFGPFCFGLDTACILSSASIIMMMIMIIIVIMMMMILMIITIIVVEIVYIE